MITQNCCFGTSGNLELIDLAFFVVLELIHVFLKLLAFCFGGRLLVFGALDGRFQISDSLL